MLHSIAIFSVCALGHICSYIVLKSIAKDDMYLRKYFLISILILGTTVVTQSILFSMLFLVFLCFIFTKGFSASERLIIFFGLLFVLPENSAVRIDPGAYFGDLTYGKCLIIGLLIPIFFKSERSFKNDKYIAIDFFSIGFLCWLMLRNLDQESITEIFRANTWIVVEFLVPYIAIRFYLKDYPAVFLAICFGLFAQIFISLFETLLTWKVYDSLRILSGYFDSYSGQYKMRYGFLRTEAVFGNPLILSYFCSFGFICALLVNKNIRSQIIEPGAKIFGIITIIVALLGVFFTGSRSGVLSIVVAFFVLNIIGWAVKRKRDPRAMVLVLTFIGIYLFFYNGQDFLQKEFPYRVLLFHTSMEVIPSNLLFGALDVYDDPRMQVLVQGEGIIDPVNTYLHITLLYGIVGLLLFLGCVLSGIRKLYIRLRNIQDESYILGLFVLCSLIILAFNLVAISPAGWVFKWVWILIPICSNIVASQGYETDLRKALFYR